MGSDSREVESVGSADAISAARSAERSQVRNEALLESLRELLHAPDLEWANEPPRPIAEGAESIVLDLALRNAGGWSGDPLVVRLLQADDPNQLEREAAVQGALAECGFPAPLPVAWGRGQPGTLEPFLIMERVSGRVMISLLPALVVSFLALGVVGLGAFGLLLGVGWYLLPVRLQRRLHGVPVEAIKRAVAKRGLDPIEFGVAAWLGRLGSQIERLALDGLAPGLQWLGTNRLGEKEVVVCHGDYWVGNIMVSRRGVTGLIDWSNAAIAPPEYDLGWNRVQDAGDFPPDLQLSEPWRSRLSALLQPIVWIAVLPHRWLYRLFRSPDIKALDYYTAYHCLRILVWSYARQHAADGAPNPWTSKRARTLVAARFAHITGVELELPQR